MAVAATRMHPKGSWERWRFVGGNGLPGIFPSTDAPLRLRHAIYGIMARHENNKKSRALPGSQDHRFAHICIALVRFVVWQICDYFCGINGFRCMKLRLKADEAGKSEIMVESVDNLPGCPES
uniref:Uncharacterized protein n=1 Tax=Oryza meridionalis TaxID=40149 RepID=A0A0E0EAW9_9ORYZ